MTEAGKAFLICWNPAEQKTELGGNKREKDKDKDVMTEPIQAGIFGWSTRNKVSLFSHFFAITKKVKLSNQKVIFYS